MKLISRVDTEEEMTKSAEFIHCTTKGTKEGKYMNSFKTLKNLHILSNYCLRREKEMDIKIIFKSEN